MDYEGVALDVGQDLGGVGRCGLCHEFARLE